VGLKEFMEREPERPEMDEGKRKRRRSQKMSQQQEGRVAKRLDGRTQSGSGTGKRRTTSKGALGGKLLLGGRKGDVETEAANLLVECKATKNKSIGIKRDWLVKITREAANSMRSPALTIAFERVPDDVDQDWALVPVGWLRALMRKAGVEGLE